MMALQYAVASGGYCVVLFWSFPPCLYTHASRMNGSCNLITTAIGIAIIYKNKTHEWCALLSHDFPVPGRALTTDQKRFHLLWVSSNSIHRPGWTQLTEIHLPLPQGKINPPSLRLLLVRSWVTVKES